MRRRQRPVRRPRTQRAPARRSRRLAPARHDQKVHSPQYRTWSSSLRCVWIATRHGGAGYVADRSAAIRRGPCARSVVPRGDVRWGVVRRCLAPCQGTRGRASSYPSSSGVTRTSVLAARSASGRQSSPGSGARATVHGRTPARPARSAASRTSQRSVVHRTGASGKRRWRALRDDRRFGCVKTLDRAASQPHDCSRRTWRAQGRR